MEMYQKDYIEKSKEEYEKINYTAWLQGEYFICSIQKAFDPKKAKYPDKPFGKNETTEDGEEIDAYESFRRQIRAMNERMREKQADMQDGKENIEES